MYSVHNSVVCWCSQHWHWSQTQFSTYSLLHYTMNYASTAVAVSLHSVIHARCVLYATHWLDAIWLSSCWRLVLYATSLFLEYLTLTQSFFCKCLAFCLFLKGIGIPLAFTSNALLIATPLGAVALCYSNFMCTLSENYSRQPQCTNHWKHLQVYI